MVSKLRPKSQPEREVKPALILKISKSALASQPKKPGSRPPTPRPAPPSRLPPGSPTLLKTKAAPPPLPPPMVLFHHLDRIFHLYRASLLGIVLLMSVVGAAGADDDAVFARPPTPRPDVNLTPRMVIIRNWANFIDTEIRQIEAQTDVFNCEVELLKCRGERPDVGKVCRFIADLLQQIEWYNMIALDLGDAIQHPNRPPPPLLTSPPGYTLRARTNISSWDLELLACQLELIDCQLQKQESEPSASRAPPMLSPSRALLNGPVPAPLNHTRSFPDPPLQRQLQLRMGRPLARDDSNEQRRLRRDEPMETLQRRLDRDDPNEPSHHLDREDAIPHRRLGREDSSLLTDPRLNRDDQLQPAVSAPPSEPPQRRLPRETDSEVAKLVKANPAVENRLLIHVKRKKLIFQNLDGERISFREFLENFETEELIAVCRLVRKNHEKLVYNQPKHIYIFRY